MIEKNNFAWNAQNVKKCTQKCKKNAPLELHNARIYKLNYIRFPCTIIYGLKYFL